MPARRRGPRRARATSAQPRIRSRSSPSASASASRRLATIRAGHPAARGATGAGRAERGRVEGRLADERLRVDREPRRAPGREDVAAVQVLVADDESRLRRGEVSRERDAFVDDGAVDGAARRLPVARQLLRPARGLVGEQAERMLGRRRPVQRAEDRRDRRERLLLRQRPELRPRAAALDQQRAARRIVPASSRTAPRPSQNASASASCSASGSPSGLSLSTASPPSGSVASTT